MNDRLTIGQWLAEIGLQQYEPFFVRHDIDVDRLGSLTEAELARIGVPLGPRKRIVAALAADTGASGWPAGGTMPAGTGEGSATARIHAERRQVTVMFADLVGPAALAERLDPEPLSQLLRTYQDTCRVVVESYGGKIAEYRGDGILVYFGWPVTYEDNAQRAVAAGLDIVAEVRALDTPERVAVRVGIATGVVVIGMVDQDNPTMPDTAIGRAPNLASRIQSLAPDDAVLIAEDTRDLLGGMFVLKDLGSHELKGIAGPTGIYEVMEMAAPESRFAVMHDDASLSPLVARDSELEFLSKIWRAVEDGHGQTVAIGGEAGVGKSRLVHELYSHLDESSHRRLLFQCSPYHQNSAFYPIVAGIERAAQFNRDDDDDDKRSKLEKFLSHWDAETSQTAALLAFMMALPLPDSNLMKLSARQRRNLTISAMVDLICKIAGRQPVIVIIEDVHWIDPTSLSMLQEMISAASDARILIVVTHRPEFSFPADLSTQVSSLRLDLLSRDESLDLIRQITNVGQLPDRVLHEIVDKTDGVPLFLEEVAKTALKGAQGCGPGPIAGEADNLKSLPRSLRDSLVARIDSSPDVKEAAQIAAVFGREFQYDIVSAIWDRDVHELTAALDRLTRDGLLQRQGIGPRSTYRFKHALVQEAAYETVLRARRRELHGAAAQSIERRSRETADRHPEVVARHYSAADMAEAAITYWLKASRLAIERSANREALSHLDEGLALLGDIDPSRQRDELELQLRLTHGHVLMFTESWTSANVMAAHDRALRLARALNDQTREFHTLWAMAACQMVKGDIAGNYEITQQLIDAADRAQDDDLQSIAHSAMGLTRWTRGEFEEVVFQKSRALGTYDRASNLKYIHMFGVDRECQALRSAALALWCLGDPVKALSYDIEQRNLARSLGYTFNLAYGLGISAGLHLRNRQPEQARQFAEEGLRISIEQGYQFTGLAALIYRGLAVAMTRPDRDAIASCDALLGEYASNGARLGLPAWRIHLAELCRAVGDHQLAMDYVEAAIADINERGERYADAEAYRVKGEIAAGQGNDSLAQSSFDTAMNLANARRARMWALRTGVSYAGWARGTKGRDHAYRLLSPLYAWFDPNTDAPDLVAARALLSELRDPLTGGDSGNAG